MEAGKDLPVGPQLVAADDLVRHSDACLNCGTPLAGPFCHACGQRDIPPYPSTRELVVDAFWELSGWDGRFAKTVRALIQHPGMLTREFLEGRRAQFLSPLRLYLMASLVYFLLAAGAPNVRVGSTELGGINVSTTGSTQHAAERVADAARRSLDDRGVDVDRNALTAEEKAKALKDIERAPSYMQPLLRRVISDPSGFRRSLLEAMPRMLFALLPVAALLISLFYRGRKYPEHLYFAIHVNAFGFLVLAVGALAKYTQLASVTLLVGLGTLIVLPIYSVKAFRRVYGGSLGSTIAKGVAIGALYGMFSLVALLLTIYVVSLTS